MPFEERRALYTRLDREFCSHTRFFGAAAWINSIFAQLFAFLPRASLPHGYPFLNEAGAALQVANLRYADALRGRHLEGPGLDQQLVSGEQRLMQTLLDSRGALNGQSVCRELNALLNERHIAGLSCRAFARSRPFSVLLRDLRRELGVALEFADERHRVRIGMGLIHHLRSQTQGLPMGKPSGSGCTLGQHCGAVS